MIVVKAFILIFHESIQHAQTLQCQRIWSNKSTILLQFCSTQRKTFKTTQAERPMTFPASEVRVLSRMTGGESD